MLKTEAVFAGEVKVSTGKIERGKQAEDNNESVQREQQLQNHRGRTEANSVGGVPDTDGDELLQARG